MSIMKYRSICIVMMLGAASMVSHAGYWRPAACRMNIASPITVYSTVIGVGENNDLTAYLPQGLPWPGRQTLKLIDIASPATGQPLAEPAKSVLNSWVTGKWVRIEIHGNDPNCFPLVEIHDELGSVNLRLVEQGYAWVTMQPRADARFMSAELRARKAKRGLWANTYSKPPAQRQKSKLESNA